MKTRTLVITIILACGGMFLAMIAVCVAAFFLVYKNVDKMVSPKVDALFAAIDNGTFGETYATETTPEFRAATSRKDYEQIGQAVKNRLGRLQSKTLTQFNAQHFPGGSCFEAAYSARFEKGSGTISVRFKSVEGEWRLLYFGVTSPELIKEPATKNCPFCGEPNPVTAKFCANCGKPLAGDKPAAGGKKAKHPSH
jgi:hypothetical protein